MCLNLIEIPNPCIKKNYKVEGYVSEQGELKKINTELLPSTDTIRVACGKCAECRQAKIDEYFQRAVVESAFCMVFFITLTFDDAHLQKEKIGDKYYAYADYSIIDDMMKRLRKSGVLGRDFKYLAVNEYGSEKHRPHIHIYFCIPKSKEDDENTGFYFEKLLFDNLQKYFAINKGSRKKPIYEPVFTYKVRRRGNKVESNYFVKYVEPVEYTNQVKFFQDYNYIKTIQYLINYVNKTDSFEEGLYKRIEQYKESDPLLYRKLYYKFKSRIRTSHNFGDGWKEDLTSEKLHKISVRTTEKVFQFTQIIDSFPKTYEEFAEKYDWMNTDLLEWRERDFYKNFSTWKNCINSMSGEEYILHCLYIKYFKKEFNEKYKFIKGSKERELYNYFNKSTGDYEQVTIVKNKLLQPTIANIFAQCHQTDYCPQVVRTKEIQQTKVYNYLRTMVEESIDKGLVCISFKNTLKQRYEPLCKYYRERVTTIDDTIRLWKKLGVKNFEEWTELFAKVRKENRVGNIQRGNEIKYFNVDEFGEKVQDLNNEYNLYQNLFTDRKYKKH